MSHILPLPVSFMNEKGLHLQITAFPYSLPYEQFLLTTYYILTILLCNSRITQYFPMCYKCPEQ